MKPEEVEFVGGEDPQPVDRPTRIADAMRKAAYAHPEWAENDRIIISVSGKGPDGKGQGGLFVHGFGVEDDDPLMQGISDDHREDHAKELVVQDIVGTMLEHIEALLADLLGESVKVIPFTRAAGGLVPAPPPHTHN